MALPTRTISWNNMNSAQIGEFDKNVQDGVFRENLLLNKVNAKKKTYPGGDYITVPIEYARGNGGTYSGLQVLTPTDKELITTAVFTPAHYEVDITMSYTDDLANRGPGQIFDLLEAKYANAKKTMAYNLTTDLYGVGTVTGAQPIVGVGAAIDIDPTTDPTVGAYGGIARATAPGSTCWRNQYKNMTSLATLSMLKLQNLWGMCSEGTIHPDIIVTTQDVFDKIWSLADARQQLGNEEAAKMGYTSIDFNGVPLIVDKNCTAGYLYMINTDYLYLKVHKDDDMAVTPFLQGTTQLAKVKFITWTGQLVCSNPQYQGVAFNLT